MGRKTFESLGRVLPGRHHIVFTKNKDVNVSLEDVDMVTDIKEIKEYIDSDDEAFVIGGASIYNMLIPYVQKLYITKIDEVFEGDTFFPEIDESIWKIEKREMRNNQ